MHIGAKHVCLGLDRRVVAAEFDGFVERGPGHFLPAPFRQQIQLGTKQQCLGLDCRVVAAEFNRLVQRGSRLLRAGPSRQQAQLGNHDERLGLLGIQFDRLLEVPERNLAPLADFFERGDALQAVMARHLGTLDERRSQDLLGERGGGFVEPFVEGALGQSDDLAQVADGVGGEFQLRGFVEVVLPLAGGKDRTGR